MTRLNPATILPGTLVRWFAVLATLVSGVLSTDVCRAQGGAERLPQIAPNEPRMVDGPLGPTIMLDELPYEDAPWMVQPEITNALKADPQPGGAAKGPPGARSGVFQKATFEAAYMPRLGDLGLGITDLFASALFGLPAPTREMPLLLMPAFATHFLDGPTNPDLPPVLYDSSFQVRWLFPIGDYWMVDSAVTPGFYGDYKIDNGEAFRLPGRIVAIYKPNTLAMLIIGAAYFDRPDISVLPVGGVIWNPTDDWKVEVVVPRPRIGYRFWASPDGTAESWSYLGGEFGGGVWAIQRADGRPDVVTMKDYRILFGLERKRVGGWGGNFEFGYVFGRSISYHETDTPDFDPDPTAIVRASFNY